jgi:hypothetical protein
MTLAADLLRASITARTGPPWRSKTSRLPHAPGDDDVVAEEHPEGLVAHEGPRAEDGVAEAQRLLLAHVGHGGQLGDGLDLGQLLGLSTILQVVLELEGGVEVILDGALVAAGDQHDLLEPGGYRLLHHVLDGGLVHQRQHLLGLRLGGGQEARAQAGGGENGFVRSWRVRS